MTCSENLGKGKIRKLLIDMGSAKFESLVSR